MKTTEKKQPVPTKTAPKDKKDDKGGLQSLFPYLAPFKRRMLLGLGVKITATLLELLLPALLTYILNSVIEKLQIGRVIIYGALMIVLATLSCLFHITANRMASKVSMRFTKSVRQELFEKTLALSAKDTDRFTIPSLESRITTDTYNVHSFLGMMQRMGVRAPILLIGGITISFLLDAPLALVMLLTLPFIFGILCFVRMRGVPMYEEVQRSVDGMVRVVREDVQGMRVIKALSKTDYENKKYDEANRKLSRNDLRAAIVMGITPAIMTLLMNLGIAGVVALSAFRVANGATSGATVIAFMQYFTQISMAMMALSRMFVMYTKSAASAKRIAEVIDTENPLIVDKMTTKVDTDAHIVFDKVDFSYRGKRNNLEDISFSLPRGSSLGIIGATGSGKSTLIRLLMRFYDPTAGKILIDGYALPYYTKEELSAKFGAAQQNDALFSDTIAENIRFGREISDEDIRRAAKIAQASEFIDALPDGYEHMLAQKGSNLSGGQKQRLLIARAIAGRPEILILDDSSSALDYKTDANLRRALREELSSTVITVAQRVSSVRSCDLILVLEEGRLIGHGTHEHLLASCPEYREISESQMGGAFLE